MSNGSELKSAGAKALRAAGYKPCPRWWLTQEQMELVKYMATQNSEDVNRIRAEARQAAQFAAPLTTERRKAWEIKQAWRSVRGSKK